MLSRAGVPINLQSAPMYPQLGTKCSYAPHEDYAPYEDKKAA